MTHRTESVRVNGVRVDVHVARGSSASALAPLVLLHGVGSSSLTYDWLLPQVSDRDVYRVDFHGHGTSERAPGTYTMPYYYEDAVRVLRDVVRRPAVVAGFSLGGEIAWRLAQRDPDLLRAVLLEDPIVFLDPKWVENGMPTILAHTIEQEIDWVTRGVSHQQAAAELATNPAAPGVTMGDLLHPDGVYTLAVSTILRDRGTMHAAIDETMSVGIDTESPLRVPAVIVSGSDELGAVFTSADEAVVARTHPEIPVHRVVSGHDVHNSRGGREVYTRLLRELLDEHGGEAPPA